MASDGQLRTFVKKLGRQVAALQEQVDSLSALVDDFQEGDTEEDELETCESEVEIVSIKAKITEVNDQWSKYAWKLIVRNRSGEPAKLNASVDFLDSDGFIVADSQAYDLVVPARAEKGFTGYELINADIVDNIASVSAKVEPA